MVPSEVLNSFERKIVLGQPSFWLTRFNKSSDILEKKINSRHQIGFYSATNHGDNLFLKKFKGKHPLRR